MKAFRLAATLAAAMVALLVLGACSNGGSINSGMPTNTSMTQTLGGSQTSVDTDSSTDSDLERDGDHRSVLRQLDDTTTIGSTVDPINGDQNPYGLDIARTDAGKLERGDLVVCNFNNGANVQGTGTTIVALHPHAGATPTRIIQSPSLLGCPALALGPTDAIWAAAFAANDNPIVSPGGALLTTLPGGPWHGPFGQAFAPQARPFTTAAFYESNASNGSIVRININPGPTFTFDVIATGFPVNNGVPGSILGPSGLQYDAKHDRLYIVDGTNNALYAFRHVSTIPAGGIVVKGTTFSGPFARRARLIFSGPPLNGPISSALLDNGHLVLGNTLDPNGKNLMVELTPHGTLLATKNVDTGAAGAIFGMVATGGDQETKLYFNDDNLNSVVVLTR
jgi:hypothetical protein